MTAPAQSPDTNGQQGASRIYTEEIFTCRLCPNRVGKADYLNRCWGQDGYIDVFVCTGMEEYTEIPQQIGEEGFEEFPDWCPLSKEDTRRQPQQPDALATIAKIREFLLAIQCADCPQGREMNDATCQKYGEEFDSTDPCLVCKFDAAVATIKQEREQR